MATKLHELLAVEGNLKNQAEKTRGELLQTFEKKRHLFAEKRVTFLPDGEGTAPVTEEQLDLQTTIMSELGWITGIWSKALDVSYRVAGANTLAKADVVLDDGTILLRDVPATALLELEKRAMEIQDLASKIPTLDPAKGFTPDAARGQHIFKAREDMKIRTKKVQSALVLYPATKEHPAQVQLISQDVPVGKIFTQEWSGLITPSAKADMINRAERLHRAIKAARARANAVELDPPAKVGQSLLEFVFGL